MIILQGKPYENPSGLTIQKFISAQTQIAGVRVTIRGAVPHVVASVIVWALHINHSPVAAREGSARNSTLPSPSDSDMVTSLSFHWPKQVIWPCLMASAGRARGIGYGERQSCLPHTYLRSRRVWVLSAAFVSYHCTNDILFECGAHADLIKDLKCMVT